MGLLFLPVLLAIMYFVMIRPQQKRAAEHRQLLASIETGDEVVTSGGFYGVITDFDGPTVFLEIADGVEMKVTRDSVAGVVNYDDADDADESDEAETKGPIS